MAQKNSGKQDGPRENWFIVGIEHDDGTIVRDEEGRVVIHIEQRFNMNDADACSGWLYKQGYWTRIYKGQEYRYNKEAGELQEYHEDQSPS